MSTRLSVPEHPNSRHLLYGGCRRGRVLIRWSSLNSRSNQETKGASTENCKYPLKGTNWYPPPPPSLSTPPSNRGTKVVPPRGY